MPDRAADLLARYRLFGLNPPPWAHPLPPSIPFVGGKYGRWGGILVYGSAENLAGYEREPNTIPSFLRDERVTNRHRAAFDDEDYGDFFPRVHMAPFNDGSLLVAAWYYVRRKNDELPDDPRDLLESIAAANFCKFSITGTTNKDYAGDDDKLAASLPYVLADLETLQPATVILPRSIWKHASIRDAVLSVAPEAEILPLPQFNPRVVQVHLKRHAARAAALERDLRATVLPSWVSKMKGYAEGAPYRFLVEMDEVLETRAT